MRWQRYDGASNMQDKLNGLKTLILNDNLVAYYVHCFAHQFQLTLVVVAKNLIQIATFFSLVNRVFNLVGASCERCETLSEKWVAEVVEALKNNEISTGCDLNQEKNLKRLDETRWSSHYGAAISLITMFSSVINTVEDIVEDGLNSEQKADANILIQSLQTFDFCFQFTFDEKCFGNYKWVISSTTTKRSWYSECNEVSWNFKAAFVSYERRWVEFIFEEVSKFCAKNNIVVPNMDELYQPQSRQKAQDVKNLHYYPVELYYTVINMQLQELNNRFNEASSKLLLCVACLSFR